MPSMPIGMFFGMPGAEETKAITKQFARIGQPTVEAAEGGDLHQKRVGKLKNKYWETTKFPPVWCLGMNQCSPMCRHPTENNRGQFGTVNLRIASTSHWEIRDIFRQAVNYRPNNKGQSTDHQTKTTNIWTVAFLMESTISGPTRTHQPAVSTLPEHAVIIPALPWNIVDAVASNYIDSIKRLSTRPHTLTHALVQ